MKNAIVEAINETMTAKQFLNVIGFQLDGQKIKAKIDRATTKATGAQMVLYVDDVNMNKVMKNVMSTMEDFATYVPTEFKYTKYNIIAHNFVIRAKGTVTIFVDSDDPKKGANIFFTDNTKKNKLEKFNEEQFEAI